MEIGLHSVAPISFRGSNNGELVKSTNKCPNIKVCKIDGSNKSKAFLCPTVSVFCTVMALLQTIVFISSKLIVRRAHLFNYWYTGQFYDILVFKSDESCKLWQYITYAFVHASTWHLGFNILMQITVGTMMELIIGSAATAFIYLSGIVAGALITTMTESRVYLIGASGAIYAMLAAYIVLVLITDQSKCATICWLIVAFIIVFCDIFLAVSTQYRQNGLFGVRTAYAAHLGGAITGLTLGAIFGRHNGDPYFRWIVWASGIIYDCLLIGFVIGYSKLW